MCAKTGDAADGLATVEFTSTPSWIWILLLFGILPFLIARSFSRVRVLALIPMSEAALRRGRWFNWIYRGLLVLGALLLATGITTDLPVVWAGLTAFIGALLVLVVGWPFVWPTGQVHGDWVWLSFVDERFARELGRWYGPRARSP